MHAVWLRRRSAPSTRRRHTNSSWAARDLGSSMMRNASAFATRLRRRSASSMRRRLDRGCKPIHEAKLMRRQASRLRKRHIMRFCSLSLPHHRHRPYPDWHLTQARLVAPTSPSRPVALSPSTSGYVPALGHQIAHNTLSYIGFGSHPPVPPEVPTHGLPTDSVVDSHLAFDLKYDT